MKILGLIICWVVGIFFPPFLVVALFVTIIEYLDHKTDNMDVFKPDEETGRTSAAGCGAAMSLIIFTILGLVGSLAAMIYLTDIYLGAIK